MADFSKIGRASRRKGNTFQNTVAKMLTKAWGVPILWTPMSGGLSIRGDLMVGGDPPKYVLAYNIECKHRKDVTLKRFVNNPDLVEVNSKQVVIFRDDGETWMVFAVAGPPIGPPSLEVTAHPPYIRVRYPDGESVGFVRLTGPGSEEYLRAIKPYMLRRVGQYIPKKKRRGKGRPPE